jgi:tetratricopeptide (TPR) repeat protein
MSSRYSTEALRAAGSLSCGLAAAVCALWLAACADLQPQAPRRGAPPPAPAEPTPAPEQPSTPASAAGPAGAAPVAPPLPPRALADFNRAVGAMRAGNTTEAELEFKQIAVSYPQLSTPYVNLGILYRRSGRLDQSEEALRTAVEHNETSALAWTELGATQRLRGKFQDAAASYEKAIAADPNFAPAYRNLGVVSDLYLADPERALTAFERYKELTGEDKPVSGWIAELRQRTGKPAVRPAAAPAPAPAPPGPEDAPAAPQAPPANAPAGAPAGAPATTPAPPPAEPTPKAGG